MVPDLKQKGVKRGGEKSVKSGMTVQTERSGERSARLGVFAERVAFQV